jgi:hypothetical protein
LSLLIRAGIISLSSSDYLVLLLLLLLLQQISFTLHISNWQSLLINVYLK